MQWARASAIALLSLVVLAGVASAQLIDSPGRYDVTVVAVPAFTPAGVPPLGPSAYPGELQVRETGNSWHVVFRGESASGDKLVIQAKFERGWRGVRVGPLPVGLGVIPNAVIGIDVDHLERAHVQGEGLVGGVTRRLNAQVGRGGSVEHVEIH
jgi:hypothetical protein